MPGGDRTGPNGMGSQTGRAAGYCSGNSTPGFMNSAVGRAGAGVGRGGFPRGGGRGRAGGGIRGGIAGFSPVPIAYNQQLPSQISSQEEIDLLKQQINIANGRIKELEKHDTAEKKG